MPNWCENDLYVSGSAADVEEVLVAIGGDESQPGFDFNVLIPYPEHFAKLDREMEELGPQGFADRHGAEARDGFNAGGYEWCVKNWGTKWNASDVARRDYDGVCLSFKTAWAPPTPVILALHKRFPRCTLRLEFFEAGNGVCGGFSCVAEDDWIDEDQPWEAGVATAEWEGAYGGHRGG